MKTAKHITQRRPKPSSTGGSTRASHSERRKLTSEVSKHLFSSRQKWPRSRVVILVVLFEIFLLWLYENSTSFATSLATGRGRSYIIKDLGSEEGEGDVTSNVTAILSRTSTAIGYNRFPPLKIPERRDEYFFQYTSKQNMGINYTLSVLRAMGINRSEVVDRGLLDQIPPWWQIIENYGKEPIILGLERCADFRERVHRRHVAPAGMFSTGTNLLQQMLFDNCAPPLPEQRPRMFNLWQVPWGKHNPSAARLHHIAIHQRDRNQSAVLPVVMMRHPYTWLYTVCTHPYSFQWEHREEYCDRSLFLKFQVQANFGARKSHIAGIPDTYESLIHAWRDWNAAYYEVRDYPLLIVRFEDLVFRPREVVQKVCECAGGTIGEPFWYLKEPANLGTGHGTHRSDLLAAVVRYGMPLNLYKKMYSQLDWSIIRRVLDEDMGLMEAMGYHT